MTTGPSAASRDLARRLLTRETTATDVASAMPLQEAWTRIANSLRRAVGDDGFSALLVRALKSAEARHPALADISRVDDAGAQLDMAAGVEAHGVAAVAEALELVVASLIDVLGSLIGADMVLNLLDENGVSSRAATDKEAS